MYTFIIIKFYCFFLNFSYVYNLKTLFALSYYFLISLKGIKYDADGNYNNLWSENTENEFKNKLQCLKNQYSNYSVNKNLVS